MTEGWAVGIVCQRPNFSPQSNFCAARNGKFVDFPGEMRYNGTWGVIYGTNDSVGSGQYIAHPRGHAFRAHARRAARGHGAGRAGGAGQRAHGGGHARFGGGNPGERAAYRLQWRAGLGFAGGTCGGTVPTCVRGREGDLPHGRRTRTAHSGLSGRRLFL